MRQNVTSSVLSRVTQIMCLAHCSYEKQPPSPGHYQCKDNERHFVHCSKSRGVRSPQTSGQGGFPSEGHLGALGTELHTWPLNPDRESTASWLASALGSNHSTVGASSCRTCMQKPNTLFRESQLPLGPSFSLDHPSQAGILITL